jgi:predicted 3-demethylubiquinone-9 3-methyltransferase (glyoxalase superfamily)
MADMQKIVPNLWFDTEAEEAAEYYISIFDNSRVLHKSHYGEAGPREAGMVLTIEFELEGQRFTAINGGPEFKFDEAISFLVSCEDQNEVDEKWAKLTEGGEEGPCGWLKDKFGLSWQIIPKGMDEMLASDDAEKSGRAMSEMLKMKKIDLAALEKAYAG